MSACGIRTIFLTFFFALFCFSGQAIGADDPIPSFLMKNPAGDHNSKDLFTGRRVVFAVIGRSCLGFSPFLGFSKKLPKGKADRVLFLCIDGIPSPGGKPKELDSNLFIGSNKAMRALGLTGTPMILGIEENRVKWRLAGLVPHWEVLAENWLTPPAP